MPPNRHTITGHAFEVFAVCEDDEARQIILAIEMLWGDPSRRPQHYGRDSDGCMIPWIEAGRLLVGYFVKHSAKHVFILEIQRLAF